MELAIGHCGMAYHIAAAGFPMDQTTGSSGIDKGQLLEIPV
jgi:hypothetical protein